MGGSCNMCERCIEFRVENLEGRNHLGDFEAVFK
jgi:hypothetical protein